MGSRPWLRHSHRELGRLALAGLEKGNLARRRLSIHRMEPLSFGARPLRLLLLGLFLGLLPPALPAPSEAVHRLAPYTVTGTRLALDPEASGLGRMTRDAADLEGLNPVGLTEALRRLPGLHADQAGASGDSEPVFLHGGEPNFTLALVDGIRLNDSTNTRGGGGDFSLVDPWFVQEVSVIPGAQSSVYGSEALNGAIALSLRPEGERPEERRRVLAEAGGRDYWKAGLEWRDAIGDATAFAVVSATDEGDPAPGASFSGERVGLGATVPAGQGRQIQATGLYANTESSGFPDDSGGSRLAVRREVERRQTEAYGWALRLRHKLGGHRLEAEASAFGRASATQSPGVAPGLRDPAGLPGSSFSNDFRRWQLQVHDRFSPADGVETAFGGAYVRERGASESVLRFPGFDLPGAFEIDRETWSGFAETRVRLGKKFDLGAGLRWDQAEGADEFLSPRLHLNYRPGSGARFHLGTGRGFKLPSFFALANPLVGNPELDEETANSVTLTWEQDWAAAALTTRVTGFRYDFDDLIDFVPGPPPMMRNVEGVSISGASAEARFAIGPRVDFSGHVTALDIDDGAGERAALLNRPDWRAAMALEAQPFDALKIALNGLWVGRRPDSSLPTGLVTLDRYFRADLVASWQPLADTRIRLSVDNLFDAAYEERIGFPALERRVRLMVEQSF